MADSERVYVSILDKEYQVACPQQERDALHKAATELNGRMRAVRDSGQVIGLERIAVITALNLCHELQKTDAQRRASPADTKALEQISLKLSEALEKS